MGAPLSRNSAIVHMLERASGSVRVHPDDATSVFELLPQDDAAWIVETGADAVVAVLGPGAQVIGVLVVGRRFDDRIVQPVDIPFLEAPSGDEQCAVPLVVVRGPVRDGGGSAPLRRRPHRRGGGSHRASTHRRQRPAAGRFRAAAGRARVRRLGADGQAFVAPGDGARVG